MNQARERAVHNPDAGGKQKQRLEQSGEVLDFAVAVGMVAIGRLAGDADGEPGHQGGNEIERGVRRLGQNAERAGEKADDDLESGQANGCENGTGGRFVLLLIGYGVRHAEASLSAMMARAANGKARH